jgi:hypothetical protein
MVCATPAVWITASTSANAAAMFCGKARSPITALPDCSGTMVGRRSSTRSR